MLFEILDCPSCHTKGSLSKLEDRFFDADTIHWIIFKCRLCDKILVKQYTLTDVLSCKETIILFDEDNMPIELKKAMEKYRNAAKKALLNLHEII